MKSFISFLIIMPPKTRRTTKRKRAPRRVVRRKFKRSANRYTVSVRNTSRSIIPARYITKLVYSEVFDVVLGTATPWVYAYAINGMNDPNQTGGGHQPMGFDQFATLYNNYYVSGMMIKLEGGCYAAGTWQLSLGGLNNGVAAPTANDELNESRFFITKVVTNQGRWSMKKYYSLPAVLGLPKDVPAKDENYWGLTTGTTNPNFGAQAHIQMANLDLSEQNIFQVTVTIVYYCTFFNPNEIGQS